MENKENKKQSNSGTKEQPFKDFMRYFISYSINWTWTLGSILFIVLFCMGGLKYSSPALWVLSVIPYTMLIYNLVTEYQAYTLKIMDDKWLSKAMGLIFYGACFFVLIAVIIGNIVGTFL